VDSGRGRQAVAAGVLLYIMTRGSIHIIARRRLRYRLFSLFIFN
jgi:hypothetical protein